MFKWNATWTEKHWGFKPMLRVENEKLGFFPFVVTDTEKFTKYLLFFFFYWLVMSILEIELKDHQQKQIDEYNKWVESLK
jgi:hypothetical protein